MVDGKLPVFDQEVPVLEWEMLVFDWRHFQPATAAPTASYRRFVEQSELDAPGGSIYSLV